LYKFQFSRYASRFTCVHITQRGPPTVGRTAARPGNVIGVAKTFIFMGVHYRNGCCHPPSNTYLVPVIISSECFDSPLAPLFKRNWKSPSSYTIMFLKRTKNGDACAALCLTSVRLTPSLTGIKVPNAVSNKCKSLSVNRNPLMVMKCEGEMLIRPLLRLVIQY
jgi:hypothetical protein